jgi:putative RNA 2'-phosphotransferase
MREFLVRLSKTISHALRHDPSQYGLTLEAEGWVGVEALLAALRDRNLRVNPSDFEEIINQCSKTRFEIVGDKIRATYGHSVEEKITKSVSEPPMYLYHGTSVNTYEKHIKTEGLKTMNRQYVHLSADVETAQTVGRRQGGSTVVLRVNAQHAYEWGTNFYSERNGIWLADAIDPQWLSLNR